MVGHLRLFFDLCFVVVCLGAALMVRPRDFFTVGVLPPLLMFGTMVVVALNGPKVIATAHDGVVQAVVTGLAHHSLALFAGYAVCLVTLLLRQRSALTGGSTDGPTDGTHSSKRLTSPAPSRTISG